MDHQHKRRRNARAKRVMRVRKTLSGTNMRPRLSVSKTLSHLYAQLIDDEKGITIAGVGTLSKEIQKKKSKESAQIIGKKIAQLAQKHGVNAVIFDRGRNKYHGLIAELAKSAREA
ncbi:MAG: 50S ribosomal protein L18, partial [Chlamydiae bacterium]|nr:50S ribosomal protein L18 [Chlamydiota bacterium]